VFGRRFLDLFLPALCPLALSVAFYLVNARDARSVMLDFAPGAAAPLDSGRLGDFWTLWRKYMAFGLLSFLLYAYCAIYVLLRMKQTVFSEDRSVSHTLREAADPRRYLRFVLTGIVVSIGIGIGWLFCILPGIAMMGYFCLAPACAVFDEARTVVSLGRSRRLVSGRVGQTLGVLLALGAAFLVLAMLLGLPMMIAQSSMSAAMITAADSERFLREYLESFFSPGMLACQSLMGIVSILGYLVLGFATVVMYFNYKLVPVKGPAGPPAGDVPHLQA